MGTCLGIMLIMSEHLSNASPPSSNHHRSSPSFVTWIAGVSSVQFLSNLSSRVSVLKQILVIPLLRVNPLSGFYCPKDQGHIS